jgi:hypothetical protein
MSRNKNLDIDRRLASALSGNDKLRALIVASDGSISRWAVNRAIIPEQVFFCLSGRRPYPEIRDRIATDLGIPREDVDRLIDEQTPASGVAA